MSQTTSRNITSGKTFISPTDYQLYIDSTGGEVTVVLPKIQTIFNYFNNNSGNSGFIFGFRFKDVGGSAATNNIIFEGMDNDVVNGSRTYIVSTNSASGLLIISGINNYTFVSDTASTPISPAITSVSASELLALMSGSDLTQGNYYIINDFQTIYDQPDYDSLGVAKVSVTTKTASLEPLIVFATSSSEIAKQAYSTIYPNDVIEYDISFTQTEIMNAPAKGRISLRIDDNNNRTDYDHRTILFKRYANGIGIFDSYKDNGNASSEFLTFNSADIIKDNYIGDFAIYYGSSYNSYFLLSNNVINYLDSQSVVSNKFGNLFYNNNIFSDNKITSMYGNVIGDLCYGNIISNVFYENTIASSFSNNNVVYAFYNQIGSNFNGNSVDGMYSNIIADDFNSNTIGDDFSYNTIKSSFNNNDIGNNFSENNIGYNFNNNNIVSLFRRNTVNTEVSGIDFSLSTHVYSNYNCNILTKSDLSNILTYIDAGNNVIYASINS